MTLTIDEAKELVEWTIFLLVAGFGLCCWIWRMNQPAPAEDHSADTERLDWLEDQIQCGVITSAFEMDGGVFLDVEVMGEPERSYRDRDDLRAAIDDARANDDHCGDKDPRSCWNVACQLGEHCRRAAAIAKARRSAP